MDRAPAKGVPVRFRGVKEHLKKVFFNTSKSYLIMNADIYVASCKNEKRIKKEIRQLNQLINNAIKNNRYQEIESFTPIIALLYSVYAEVAFFKMIHTPYGFEDSYIEQILSQRNLEDKWTKCLDFAFDRIQNDTNKGEVANKRKQLNDILNEYIIEPSQVRNKIAHGQWSVCLNSTNTAINNETTTKIQNLDCVQIYTLFEIYNRFAECIEDLIESPYKAHYQYYYPKMEELKQYIDKTKGYSLDTKKTLLQSSQKYKSHKLR